MQEAPYGEPDYYRERYRNTDVKRFVAEEHTGLLERIKREDVERSFKRKDPFPWDCNIISCTPTLELGVDIGDLSSVILCSVPPSGASYLQRIGRAGRHDGNALTLAVAGARAHDLYYYADPQEMMSGHVEVPGTFLRAPDVLKRQLAAFCMDSWVASGISKNAVSKSLGKILDTINKKDPSAFPHNWLDYAEKRSGMLSEAFCALFERDIDEEIAEQMKNFLDPQSDPSLRSTILLSLKRVADERSDLNRALNGVKKDLQTLEEKPRDLCYDDDKKELKRRQAGLRSLRGALNRTSTFNFLCDAGILPNYAFPPKRDYPKVYPFRRGCGRKHQGTVQGICTSGHAGHSGAGTGQYVLCARPQG